MTRTRLLLAASPAAKLTAVVVFPTPPLLFVIAMARFFHGTRRDVDMYTGTHVCVCTYLV